MYRTGKQHDELVAFHRALTELVRVYQFRDRDRICCYDVSVTQCYALEALVLRGPVTLNDLAAELYLDKSTASRVADGLERKGYAKRGPHPESRRSVLLRATEAGVELHGRIERDLLAQEAELLAEFPADVRRSMTHLLESLARATCARVEASGGVCCTIQPLTLSATGRARMSRRVAGSTPGHVAESTPGRASESTVERATESTPRRASQSTVERATESASRHVSESTSGRVTESTSRRVTESTPEQPRS